MSLSKTIRNNIRSLNSRIDRLAGDTREKATELRTPKEKKKWDKRYDDVIQNNRINLPLNVRMEQSAVTNIVKQSKANDESWTLDVMLYREGVREGDNKKPAFTYKTEYGELKYYPRWPPR